MEKEESDDEVFKSFIQTSTTFLSESCVKKAIQDIANSDEIAAVLGKAASAVPPGQDWYGTMNQ
jgi:hypothetical protein